MAITFGSQTARISELEDAPERAHAPDLQDAQELQDASELQDGPEREEAPMSLSALTIAPNLDPYLDTGLDPDLDPVADGEAGAAGFDFSLMWANQRAENAEVEAAFERAQWARMRFEALRLAELADDLSSRVAELEEELAASNTETMRLHGLVVATRLDAAQARADRAELANEVMVIADRLEETENKLGAARGDVAEAKALAAEQQRKSATDRANLESAVRLATEFDELRRDRRKERDSARVEAEHNRQLLTQATDRIAELEQQVRDNSAIDDVRLAELSRIAQQEINEAFAAGSRLGERAALQVASLERELAVVREQRDALASEVDARYVGSAAS